MRVVPRLIPDALSDRMRDLASYKVTTTEVTIPSTRMLAGMTIRRVRIEAVARIKLNVI
jgi:hypothetical protein